MERYSDRIKNMTFSQTFVMSNRARALAAEGKNVISLTLGEPDFDVPENIKNAAIEAIDQNYSHYSPVPGFLELREAICEKLKRDNNLDFGPTQICVSNGAKQSIFNVLASIINEGDEVILPAPFWVSYAEMVKLMGGKPVAVQTGIETDFKITGEQLEKAITGRTKAILYSSPCNPSGSVYTRAELYQLAKIIENYPQITVISDEIYEFINYHGTHASMAEFAEVQDQVAVINGMSKAYAMTGWRIGYSACPEWLATACEKIQGQVTSGANTIAQRAAITALKTPPSEFRYMIEAFQRRRDVFYKLMSEIPGFKVNYPHAAFYLFPDVSFYLGKTLNGKYIANSDDFAMFLLENALVGCVGGQSFGSPECVRFSYAASEENLIEASRRIKHLVTNLN